VLAGANLLNELVALNSLTVLELVAATGERASMRFLELFALDIRNSYTCRAAGRIPGVVR
jgi:hypothetical protein